MTLDDDWKLAERAHQLDDAPAAPTRVPYTSALLDVEGRAVFPRRAAPAGAAPEQ